MRLPEPLVAKILSVVQKHFGSVNVYLFGSRVLDTGSGGDVDLAIESNLDPEDFSYRCEHVRYDLEQVDFPLPLDFVQWNSATDPLLAAELRAQAVLLK